MYFEISIDQVLKMVIEKYNVYAEEQGFEKMNYIGRKLTRIPCQV